MRADHPPVILGQALFDFNADGTSDVLSLIWVSGRHFIDEEVWCGGGGREKYTGDFIFRVQFGNNGQTVDTSLESLCSGEFAWIDANEVQPWAFEIVDYNNDRQADFTMVDYGGCNYSECYFFTVMPSGKIEKLKIEGRDSLTVSLRGSGASTKDDFNLTLTGFYHDYFYARNGRRFSNFSTGMRKAGLPLA